MSLVPYSSRDSREIVLRHNDAIVIRDPRSKQLVLRGTSNTTESGTCPTCHQPIRPQSPERETRPPGRQESFVSPEYFRMLQLANEGNHEDHPPSSPIRRLVQPAFPTPRGTGSSSLRGAEFVASTPAEPENAESQGIKREALSPNYFKRFFTEEKELGRGGKGVVLLVRHELDGVVLGHFACKRVPVGDDHAWLEKVLIEVQLLQRLSHPNLVSYRHVWLEDVKLNRFSPSVPCAFILQEYCNSGDLLHYIIGSSPNATSTKEQLKEQMRRKSKCHADRPHDLKSLQRKLAFEEIFSFFKDITSGLAHLHASNYIHRDLKPSNCLLHKSGNDFRCLISDFGEVQAENVVRKSTGATGTISYCAPEVLKKDSTGRYANFTTKSDIFSLGMILYFMCFGRLPYSSAESIQEEFEDLDILRAEISTWSGFKDERQERPDLPGQLYEFLIRLLAINPLERPSAEEILHAIRTETGLESPPRVGRKNSSNGNLRLDLGIGKRIQTLDTPASGTPEPRSDSRPPFVTPEDADHERHERTTISPPPEPSSIDLPPKEPSKDFISRRDRSQTPPTPLLMPPPSTPLSRFKNQLVVYRHYAFHWAMRNQQALAHGAKLVIFVIKMYALTRPCMPLATNTAVAYPLLLFAAVELAFGRVVPWRISGILIAIHLAVLATAMKLNRLCAKGRPGWDW